MKISYFDIHRRVLAIFGLSVGLVMIKNLQREGEYFLIDRHLSDRQVHLMRWSGGSPSNIDDVNFLGNNERILGSVQVMREGTTIESFGTFREFLTALAMG